MTAQRKDRTGAWFAALMLVSVIFGGPARAWADSDAERATLKGLGEVYVLVEELKPDAERDGLSRSQLQTDAEGRLRRAGIRLLKQEETLNTPGTPTLYIRVTTSKSDGGMYAFSIEVRFQQSVFLDREPTIFHFSAPTWETSTVGTVGADNLRTVMDIVRNAVDRFVNAYGSVNPRP